MTNEFVVCATLVLLLRLRLLLGDASVRPPSWAAKCAIELAALGLFAPSRMLWALAATSVGINALSAWADRRAADRNGSRLLLGIVHVLLLSVWLSSAAGVRFRPELHGLADWLESWSALGGEARRLVGPAGMKMAFGMLLAANEANLLVRWLLGRLQIKPGAPSLLGPTIDASEFNRGRVIGLLERVLIYAFVLTGQFGAIGFTLAAKGFTRFKELENRGFAEYVLIGTLLSSSVAMAIGAWIKSVL
ncbi:hypothetical protein [Opitutus terrae]|uniref:Uncharacterized protein n=1 Tax=Opitutus terrae (strain DSM 11246 / JCM 15787 / PB90-1) TaxID=452637 RepID=B1ZUX1_OPITP|nr:hypothetical protein [Opitutus terrae]ACB75941.1 hypothetical protein Oter_2660 [Opitutus terrae PB90-1]